MPTPDHQRAYGANAGGQSHVGHRFCVGDALYYDRAFRILYMIDESNREVLASAADVILPVARILRVMEEV